MLKNKNILNNKDFLAIAFTILISIGIYGKFISTPFGDYDTWFERIAYGGYKFNDLPKPLQKLEIPTNLNEYIKYREKVVGRLFGGALPTYVMMSVFGNWAVGWRMALYLIIFFTYWLLYSILKKLQVPYWHRVIILLFFIIFLKSYFFQPMYILYGVSHLFFLLTIWLELCNSGLKKCHIGYSILGSGFVFLSLFIRDLSAVSILSLLAILLFWNQEQDHIEIRFKWNWQRLLPYILAAIFFAGLYLRMSLHKIDHSYSNLVSWKIDSSYFKRLILLFLNWIGLERSIYLGLFISGFIGLIALLTLFKSRYIPDTTTIFIFIFGLLLIVPALLLIPLLKHGTGNSDLKFDGNGSFTLQYMACMIILSSVISYMEKSKVSLTLKKTAHLLLIFILASIWLVYALDAKQEAEIACDDAIVTYQTVKFAVDHVPQNGIVELEGFSITSAYSFVSDMFISGRRDNIQYRMKTIPDVDERAKYLEYLKAGFSIHDQDNKESIVIIKKWRLPVGSEKLKQARNNFVKVFRRAVTKYSLGYLIGEKSERNNDSEQRKYSPWDIFCTKFIFGVRPETYRNQMLKEIGYSFYYTESLGMLYP